MINDLTSIGIINNDICDEILLYGKDDWSIKQNQDLFNIVHKFILDTKRFR
jgi:hypothetical protein